MAQLDLVCETRVPRGLRPRLRVVMLQLMRRREVSGTVCVVLTDDQRMRALKRQHWHEDATTDVLSFPTWEPGDPFKPAHLGDIVISVPVALEQARAGEHSLEIEVCVLAAHGLTHLLGFDHQTEAGWAPFHAAERDVKRIFKTFDQKTSSGTVGLSSKSTVSDNKTHARGEVAVPRGPA
jgi:probable rRNA maturation factor